MKKDTPKGSKIYARLVKEAVCYWPLFIITTIGNLLYSGIDSYSTYLFKPILDKGFMGGDTHFLKMLPFIVIGLFLLRGVAGLVSNYTLGWIQRRVVYKFRLRMFDHMLRLPAAYYDEMTSGQLLSKVLYNVEQVANCNNEALTIVVRQGALIIGLLCVMLVANWKLAICIFIICPVVVLVVKRAAKRFRKYSKRIQQSMGNLTHVAEESIVGYREVRIFEAQEHQRKLFAKLIDYNFKQEMKLVLTGAINTPLVQFFGSLVLALVIYIAFHQLTDITAGSFITLFTSMLLILNPIKQLTRVNGTIQKGIAAAESIYELIDQPPEEDKGTTTLQAISGQVTFDDVFFRYPHGKDDVLKGLTLDIQPGQTVALVGRSGGGKSTVVSLLSRFYQPTRGKVMFDGIDTQELTLMNVRKHVSVVSQHVNLFDETIRHNIAYGDLEGATDERIIEAAKAAYAWEFINELPDGLDTLIGENGLKLSGGQRQRIAIARAILKDAPILILDEATSALDNESERAVQKAIDNLKKDRTTIVIAHRLSTIESADNIVVMVKGEAVESGTHQELMAAKGQYYQLHQSAIV